MAIALVSNATSNTGTTSAINTTGATLLVLSISYNTSLGVSTISDSKSNTWTPLTEHSEAGGLANRLYYVANPVVGSGHTFTAAGASNFNVICVQAFSGVLTVSPFDQETGSAAVGLNVRPGAIIPPQSGEVFVTGLINNDVGTQTIESGFTISDSIPYTGGVNYGGAMAYFIQTDAASLNPRWMCPGVNGPSVASMATFKATGGVPDFARTVYGSTFCLNT